MSNKLVKKATDEQVKLAGEILPDGRTLVQYTDGGRLEVIDVRELAVVDGDGKVIHDLAAEFDKNKNTKS